jgi:hypothetical protein
MTFPAITFNNELLLKFTYVRFLREASYRGLSIRDIINKVGDDRFAPFIMRNLCLMVCFLVFLFKDFYAKVKSPCEVDISMNTFIQMRTNPNIL